jgi:hypothetical protein
MEDQVPSSNIPQETGNYYQNPEGPRFQNPAEYAAAQQQQQVAQQAPPVPDFQEMRRIALEQAIQQVTQQPAPIPQQPVPQPTPPVQQYVEPEVRTVYVRRNLTLAEVVVVFAISCGLVFGIQGVWNFTTDILPRIEIREK